ncbi:MAG: DUF4347 domain-containing protein [Methylococcaceae bacterium]
MSQATAQTNQLIIIDSQVTDWQNLASSAAPDALLLILDSSSDGLTQISDYLAALPQDVVPLQSIHIISHGSEGSLRLGSSTLTGSNLSLYRKQLASLGHALTEDGDILLYGCNVGKGLEAEVFISALAEATRADVAASSDLTGSANKGGDWVLEHQQGQIDATSLDFAQWAGVLDTVGQPVIDLGSGNGQLISPVNVDGNWYYSWDRNSSGSSAEDGGDTVNHDLLDGIFNKDINGVINTTVTNADGLYGTTDTYRYATINGVRLALATRDNMLTIWTNNGSTLPDWGTVYWSCHTLNFRARSRLRRRWRHI